MIMPTISFKQKRHLDNILAEWATVLIKADEHDARRLIAKLFSIEQSIASTVLKNLKADWLPEGDELVPLYFDVSMTKVFKPTEYKILCGMLSKDSVEHNTVLALAWLVEMGLQVNEAGQVIEKIIADQP